MDILASLKSKGYDPQTSNKSMGWICSIEFNSRIRQFHGITELQAIDRAGQYVAELERRYGEQIERLSCEGCGESI